MPACLPIKINELCDLGHNLNLKTGFLQEWKEIRQTVCYLFIDMCLSLVILSMPHAQTLSSISKAVK